MKQNSHNNPYKSKQLMGPLVVALLCLTAYTLHANIHLPFAFIRTDISNGQVWRLITAHILHTNIAHLAMNVFALGALWLINRQFYTPLSYTVLCIFCALACALGLYFFNPALHHYVGLSGVLHGIVIYSALHDIYLRDKFGWLILIAIGGKILFEQWFGASDSLSQLIHARVIVDAHLYGALGGALYFLITQALKNRFKAVNLIIFNSK